MKKTASMAAKFSKPLGVFAVLLLIILVIETLLMFVLPLVLPNPNPFFENLADSVSLTLLSAPFIWLLVARPLRNAAMAEVTRTNVVLGCIVEAVINFNEQGMIESLNPAAERMFGYTPREITGQHINCIIPGLLTGIVVPPSAGHATEGASGFRTGIETVGCNKDRTDFPVEISISTLDMEARQLFMAIIHDVTERKQVALLMEKQKEFAENLVQNSAVPIFVLNSEHRVLIWNRACEELTGIKAEAMLGKDEPWRAFYVDKRPVLADIVLDGSVEHTTAYYSNLSRSSFLPEGLQAEGWYKNLNNRDRYLFFNAAPVHNSKGELLAVIETLEDITERKQYEEQLEHQATHDGLTNLPNRNLLVDRIHQALLMSHRNHQQVVVLFLDLDHFKNINDSLGHDVGDLLLKVVGERLTGCMRSGDTVARQGGDEFVIVISNDAAADNAAQIAGKILESISQPCRIKEQEIVTTCSIGISVYPRDGEDVQTLLKNADVAMYRAKEQGRNTFQFYAEKMNANSLGLMTMENHLRRALDGDELFLHYQPKMSFSTGCITGMEALLRWKNPELGMISPASFIPLAERTGLIEPIGEWVLRTACAQNKAWQDAGLPPLTVAVNLSARQFRQKNLNSVIDRALQETGLDSQYLELEITESMVMQDVERVMALLNELKGMGVYLAMDDFGTGYSSLSYLKRFPFDRLKIDQSFVRDITSDPDSAAIAKTVIAMAHSLHLKVVAEGVETEGQLNYLRSHDCDEMQGYYFSRPIPATEFELLLREGRHLHLSCDAPRGSEKTILLVDDDAAVAEAFQERFSLEGYRVLTAGNAAEGFELLASNCVAIVVSDHHMPEMYGSEFLRRVKDLYPGTVRILLSGYNDLNPVVDAINNSAIYKFLSKPWNDNFIKEMIDEAFRYHQSTNGRGLK